MLLSSFQLFWLWTLLRFWQKLERGWGLVTKDSCGSFTLGLSLKVISFQQLFKWYVNKVALKTNEKITVEEMAWERGRADSSAYDWSVSVQTVWEEQNESRSQDKRHNTWSEGARTTFWQPQSPPRGCWWFTGLSWKVLLSGLIGVVCGPRKPGVDHYLNFSSNAFQVWGLGQSSYFTSLKQK